MISSKHLAQAIYKLSQDNVPAGKLSVAVVSYLEKYRLTALLPPVLKHLTNYEKTEKQFQTLRIVSGLPVDKEIIDEIKKIFSADRLFPVESDTDQELIGGFIATHKGFMYDASIKNQLNLLKAKLTE